MNIFQKTKEFFKYYFENSAKVFGYDSTHNLSNDEETLQEVINKKDNDLAGIFKAGAHLLENHEVSTHTKKPLPAKKTEQSTNKRAI